MKTLKSSNGFDILVDDEDFESLSVYSWFAEARKGKVVTVKRSTRVNNKKVGIYLHRHITNAPRGMFVDHINRNPLDNRKANLRVVQEGENQKNRGPDNRTKKKSSQFRGVSWNKKDKRWIASIRVNKKNIHLGCFTDETLAAEIYNKAATIHFGEFAYLNEISK